MNKLLLALLSLVSQDTLRVSVSLVSIGVRVTDSRGRNVLGLKAADFSVLDNGRAIDRQTRRSKEKAAFEPQMWFQPVDSEVPAVKVIAFCLCSGSR